MKKDLIYHHFDPQDRQAWLKLRQEVSGMNSSDTIRFGGSDIGTIRGHNPYEFKGELFYRRLGLISDKIEDTENMFWGRETEPLIAENWQYWDGLDGNYIHNKAEGKKINEGKELHAIVINPKYPHLFANIDRYFFHLVKVRRRHAILEIKNISKYVQDQYESKIPTYHIDQVFTYQMIFGDAYAEIAYLVDGKTLDVVPIQANKKVQANILSDVDRFSDLVLEGKRVMAEIEDPQERDIMLAQIEPEADDSKACEAFMSKRAKDKEEREEVEGSIEEYDLCEKVLEYRAKRKEADTQRRLYENQIKQIMIAKDSRKLQFGEAGCVVLGLNNTLYPKLNTNA